MSYEASDSRVRLGCNDAIMPCQAESIIALKGAIDAPIWFPEFDANTWKAVCEASTLGCGGVR